MSPEHPAGQSQFLLRISNLLADCPADGSASVIFLSEIRRSFNLSAWLACKDPRSGGLSWSGPADPEGEPFPLKVAQSEGGLLSAALANGHESVLDTQSIPAQTPERRYLSKSRFRSWAFLPV